MRWLNYKNMKNKLIYSKNRNKIKDGDVLLYEGKGFLSWVIKKLSHSKYSHAGMVAWWNDRLMVIEAIRKGVVVTTLSRNVTRYHGNVELYTSRKNIPEKSRLKMIKFAQKELGKEYNFLELAVIGIKIFFNKLVRLNKLKDERLICSQFVAEVYESIGIEIKENVVPPFVTPADIAESKALHLKGILKNE